ncbi:MAG: carbohydrate ABC transporter substrate-binding protein [Spirochaetales bacterium]|nr:carbohydrate ABC transporter substrate-binding protein [Spirochaetales bacterium]
MKKCFILFTALFLISISLQGFAAGKKEENRLEIIHQWIAGNEAGALKALVIIYSQRYPDVEIINTADTGDAGQNSNTVLATRMEEGNPPDSFQIHEGKEFIDTWVIPGKMEPLTFILKDNNWLSVYPGEVIDIISYNGEVYRIPVNIHRSNVLWYNKAVFRSNTIVPPVSIFDFFTIAQELANAGITPLALGDNAARAATHLLENVLLGSLDPAVYKGLWNGKTAWDSADVKKALGNFVNMLQYVNTDHAVLTWEQAAQYVIEGKCAMTIMGDWIEAYFAKKGLTPDKEYGWKASPGTSGSFLMLSDSFGLPRGALHRDRAIEWLTVCASREGQDAFNPLNGSIPCRTDGDRNLYNAYFQSAMTDFSGNTIIPGLVYNTTAAESMVKEINDVVRTFITEQDIDKAVKGFADAVRNR